MRGIRLGAVCAACSVMLAGCGLSAIFEPKPDQTRFYVLAGSAPAANTPSLGAGVSVGLGPVELPEYLERPELVVRTSATELKPSALDRWSEPLDKGFVRVLSQDLADALGLQRVLVFPWYATQEPTFQVRVDVIAFESTPQGEARLTARWEITKPGATAAAKGAAQTHVQNVSTIAKRAAGSEPADAVAALSSALGDLSTAIAAALRPLAAP